MPDIWDQFPDAQQPSVAADPWADFPDDIVSVQQKIEQPIPRSEQNFFQRLGGDIRNRAQMAGEITQKYGKGTDPRAVLPLAGKVGAGLIGDVVGEGITSAYRGAKAITPSLGEAERLAGKGIESFRNTKLSQGLSNVTDDIGNIYKEYKEKHPILSENIEGGLGVAGTLIPIKGKPAGILPFEATAKTGKGVIKTGKEVKNILTPEKMSSEELRKIGGDLFKEADYRGGILKPDITNNFLDEISKIRPQTAFGQAFSGDSKAAQLIERTKVLRDNPMSLSDAKEVDEALGDLAFSEMTDGKFSSEGVKFLEMQSKLRDTIENASDDMIVGGRDGFETLKEARKYWAASLRLRNIEKIVDNAQNYQVPDTAIKTGFRTMLRNKNILKGYTQAEIKAMEKAAKTGVLTDVLNVFGSRLLPLGIGSAGWATGGPVGGAISGVGSYAASAVARKGAEAIQMGKAKNVANVIRKRVE